MFKFYTVEEWEEYLAKEAPLRLIKRHEDNQKLFELQGWKPKYLLIQIKDLNELHCDEWIKEHCEGGVWKKYTHQYEFMLKKDALLFKIVWSKQ